MIGETRSKLNSPELKEATSQMSDILQSLKRLGSLADSRAGETLDQLERTLAQLELASKGARGWLDSSSPVYQEVIEAFNQIGDASRSLRVLVEYLERNPNALLTGRSTSQD